MPSSTLTDWLPRNEGIVSKVVTGTNERAYRLTLMPPNGPVPEGGWPVLWVLDAGLHGLTMMDTARRLARRPDATGVSPILVAGLQPVDTRPDSGHDDGQRFRDFTLGPPQHESFAGAETGGARQFADFLLGPAREALARTGLASEHPPALWGHSLSAWFALWISIEAPDRFSNVCAISPSLWWDETPFETVTGDGPGLFIAVGAREVDRPGTNRRMIERAKSLEDRLAKAGRRTAFWTGPDEDHASIVSASASAALRFISA